MEMIRFNFNAPPQTKEDNINPARSFATLTEKIRNPSWALVLSVLVQSGFYNIKKTSFVLEES